MQMCGRHAKLIPPKIEALLLAACRRERTGSHASRSASAGVLNGTGTRARTACGRKRNRVSDSDPTNWKDAPIPTLHSGYGMEALEIERQTDQAPLARRRRDPTQGELAEAQHLLDDADHRFDGA